MSFWNISFPKLKKLEMYKHWLKLINQTYTINDKSQRVVTTHQCMSRITMEQLHHIGRTVLLNKMIVLTLWYSIINNLIWRNSIKKKVRKYSYNTKFHRQQLMNFFQVKHKISVVYSDRQQAQYQYEQRHTMQLGINHNSLKPGSIATSALSIHQFLSNFLKFYECNSSITQTFTEKSFSNSSICRLDWIRIHGSNNCKVMTTKTGNGVLRVNNHFSKSDKSLVSKFWKTFNSIVSK
jgi:hypothetical protein